MALKPDTAVRVRDGQRETVAQKDLQPGDVIEVAAGGRLPADGKLITPFASFDESALTGESILRNAARAKAYWLAPPAPTVCGSLCGDFQTRRQRHRPHPASD